MNKKRKEIKISYWAAHFTTIVSVAMVLVLIGAICMLSIAAGNTAREVKQKQEISLIMTDSVSNEQAAATMQTLSARPYTHTASVITKEEALKDWNEATGDDVEAIAGYNFFTPEITLSLKPDFAVPDSIAKVQAELTALPGVEEVVMPDSEVIVSMDSFLSRTMLVLSIVAAAMIVISFVLINNTVLLAIYSRRFTIHTMQLVGATPGFIRRPFVLSNLGAGMVAGLIAAALLGGFIGFIRETQVPELEHYLNTTQTLGVCVALMVAGGLLCAGSALIATNRYLHKDYDELFT